MRRASPRSLAALALSTSMLLAASAAAETRLGVRATWLTSGGRALQPVQDGGSYGPWTVTGPGLSVDAEFVQGPVFALGVGARMSYATGEEEPYAGGNDIAVAALRVPFLLGWRIATGPIALRIGLEIGLQAGGYASNDRGFEDAGGAFGVTTGLSVGLDVPLTDAVDLTARGGAGVGAAVAGGDADASGWGEALIIGWSLPVEIGAQWRF